MKGKSSRKVHCWAGSRDKVFISNTQPFEDLDLSFSCEISNFSCLQLGQKCQKGGFSCGVEERCKNGAITCLCPYLQNSTCKRCFSSVSRRKRWKDGQLVTVGVSIKDSCRRKLKTIICPQAGKIVIAKSIIRVEL